MHPIIFVLLTMAMLYKLLVTVFKYILNSTRTIELNFSFQLAGEGGGAV